jgi:hypothetical protein
MEMWIQFNAIQRYVTDNGRLPGNLEELGVRPDGVQYRRLPDGVFQLSGKSGDVSVDYTSTEPVDELVADAMAIVTGTSTPPGAS